ncbi:hypothetical protein GVX86_01655 [[Haemophilus] felis]|nr:hypothetical protein [[Haemophilus] felis]
MNDSKLARAYDRYSDGLLEEHYQKEYAMKHFSEEAKDEDSDEHAVLTEYLSNDDMFWLAVGAGANYLEIRDSAIYDIVVNQRFYEKRREEYCAC